MTTPYIDPNIVFASDAPTQDKPPAFNNYAKGMDETRSNEGRPTIKQFNFIQQQNDFKFLYIHERGACLPFVEGFPYENNAIVFKDGLIQQKNGASWVIPFMRGSQNLAELTDVAQARTKLDVYSKSEVLSKDNNLSDLANVATARTNLDVYSKAETDAIAGTPNATETVAGKAKIATTAIAQEGVNDTDFITALKLANTRQSVWVNKTGMLFGTTYMNTALYEKEISFLSGIASGLLLTAKVTFKNLTTNIETIVYFGCVSNWTGGIASSANFVVPPNTSFKIEIVRTDSLSTVVTTAVNQWSERYYV